MYRVKVYILNIRKPVEFGFQVEAQAEKFIGQVFASGCNAKLRDDVVTFWPANRIVRAEMSRD